MTYEEWLAQVPDGLKNDPIWRFEAYPKALLLYPPLLISVFSLLIPWKGAQRKCPKSM